MAEINIGNGPTSASGSGVITDIIKQQTTVLAGNDTIVVTVNGGILPTDDDYILVSGPTGLLPQGGAITGGYTIDRGVAPNEIILNASVFFDVLFIMQFTY